MTPQLWGAILYWNAARGAATRRSMCGWIGWFRRDDEVHFCQMQIVALVRQLPRTDGLGYADWIGMLGVPHTAIARLIYHNRRMWQDMPEAKS